MQDGVVIYDASCDPCVKFRRALGFLDASRRLGFTPLKQAEEEGLLARVPPALRFRSFHIVLPSGEIRSGAAAIPDLFVLLPAGKLAPRAVSSAPVGNALEFLYSVASRLHEGRACRAKASGESGLGRASVPVESTAS